MASDPYTRIRSHAVYRNPWVAVEAHEIVHPTGVEGEHLLIVTPQSCGVIVEDGDELLFTRQPRFAAQRDVTEIVKGGQDPGESPLESAQRELREELGVTARRWSDLGLLYEIPSIVDPPVIIFLASDVEIGSARPEGQERISMIRLKFAAAIEASLRGDIDDAVTIAALFRYAAKRDLLLR